MLAMILFLLLVAIIFGIGFVVKWLFYIAIALALIWIIGFFFRGANGRWYRW
jgi:hypothetical protein